MSAAKSLPSIALLERCVMRAERAGDVPTLQLLMGRLDLLNYKMVGIAAKVHHEFPCLAVPAVLPHLQTVSKFGLSSVGQRCAPRP